MCRMETRLYIIDRILKHPTHRWAFLAWVLYKPTLSAHREVRLGEWRSRVCQKSQKSVKDFHVHICLLCGVCLGILQYNATSEYAFIML